jgi:CheY-like chemotaxis protein
MKDEAGDSGDRRPSVEGGLYLILVAEGEQLMRPIIVQLVPSEGYEIREANTAGCASTRVR